MLTTTCVVLNIQCSTVIFLNDIVLPFLIRENSLHPSVIVSFHGYRHTAVKSYVICCYIDSECCHCEIHTGRKPEALRGLPHYQIRFTLWSYHCHFRLTLQKKPSVFRIYSSRLALWSLGISASHWRKPFIYCFMAADPGIPSTEFLSLHSIAVRHDISESGVKIIVGYSNKVPYPSKAFFEEVHCF